MNTVQKDLHQNNLDARNKRDRAAVKMSKYLRKHQLDPAKDWTKDPVHGPKLLKWMKIIRLYDKKTTALEIRERVVKTPKKPNKDVLLPKVKKTDRYNSIYDYPNLEDGVPLSPADKKAYRQKIRRLNQARVPKEKAETMALEYLKEWVAKNRTKSNS